MQKRWSEKQQKEPRQKNRYGALHQQPLKPPSSGISLVNPISSYQTLVCLEVLIAITTASRSLLFLFSCKASKNVIGVASIYNNGLIAVRRDSPTTTLLWLTRDKYL